MVNKTIENIELNEKDYCPTPTKKKKKKKEFTQYNLINNEAKQIRPFFHQSALQSSCPSFLTVEKRLPITCSADHIGMKLSVINEPLTLYLYNCNSYTLYH